MIRNIEKHPRHGYRFMPEHVTQFLAALEHRQRWMSDSPKHDGKKSYWRIMREKSQADERQEELEKLKAWPLCDMVRVIAEAPDRQVRLALKEGLISYPSVIRWTTLFTVPSCSRWIRPLRRPRIPSSRRTMQPPRVCVTTECGRSGRPMHVLGGHLAVVEIFCGHFLALSRCCKREPCFAYGSRS